MNNDHLITRIAAIKAAHPGNLMARHFSAEYYASLTPEEQESFTAVIRSGLENPDSQMGAYAMSGEDYDRFAPQLEPMIRDYHNIAPDTPILQTHDWGRGGEPCDLSTIDPSLSDASMRVRVARNAADFPLPGAMSQADRVAFEDRMVEVFQSLIDHPAFGGRYLSLTPGSPHEIDEQEYTRRVAAHQMFKDMSADAYLNAAGISGHWPHGRGIYISEAEDFLVWVGEEDHLRIMAMQRGSNLDALFIRLQFGLAKIQKLAPAFATSPRFGAVTSCPTNIGTGMRASLHLKLPNLTSNGTDLATLKTHAKRLKLSIRGIGGEHTDAGADGLVDISPSARLGVTEREIMQAIYDGVAELWKLETADT